jgi:hypothetical protein
MAAMDTFMPGIRTGNFAPWRAGGFAGNQLIHSSFIPAKSVSSRRMTVALTTRSREVPAALRMADTFSKHCLVCSWIVSPTIFPVNGSCGPVPETNTRPAARTAWLYVGGGDGALGVRMMSLAINLSDASGMIWIALRGTPGMIQRPRIMMRPERSNGESSHTRRRHCADDEPADVVGGIPRCRERMVSDVAVAQACPSGKLELICSRGSSVHVLRHD